MKSITLIRAILTLTLMSVSLFATAARLEVSPDSHISLHIGAGLLLYTHIIGGALGLLAGLIASLSKKGAFLHRSTGKIFLVSMLACYGIGAAVAPFLDVGQRVNFVAAILALYLLVSGIQTVRQKSYKASRFNWVGLFISFSVAMLGILFMYMGSQSESGTVDGSPPDAFVLFIIAGTLSFIGEARVLIIKQLKAQGRIYRHLWRMCFSFFIASGSLFSGQIQMFPEWFAQSPLPIICSLFPLLVLAYWTVKILIQKARSHIQQRQSRLTTSV